MQVLYEHIVEGFTETARTTVTVPYSFGQEVIAR